LEYLALYGSELKLLDFFSEFLGSVDASFVSFSHCLIAAAVCLLMVEFIIYLDFNAFFWYAFFFLILLCLLINV
jgi:hypothetical protein